MSEIQKIFRYQCTTSRFSVNTVILAVLVFMLAVSTVAALGGTHTLPYANHSGYSTSLVLVNPTGGEVKVPAFWGSYGVGGPALVVYPHATARGLTWPRTGGGVATIEVPDNLAAYTEVRDPNGQLIRIGSIAPVSDGSRIQFQDLISSSEFASYVFASAPSGSTIIVTSYRDDEPLGAEEFRIPPGGTVIPLLATGANRATVSIGSRIGAPGLLRGDVYAFALISHKPDGEQFAVAGTPVQ